MPYAKIANLRGLQKDRNTFLEWSLHSREFAEKGILHFIKSAAKRRLHWYAASFERMPNGHRLPIAHPALLYPSPFVPGPIGPIASGPYVYHSWGDTDLNLKQRKLSRLVT